MKIRLTEPCEFGDTGDVLEPDMPDIANLLIQRGVGVPQEEAGREPAGAGELPCGHAEPSPPQNKLLRPERRTRRSADVIARR